MIYYLDGYNYLFIRGKEGKSFDQDRKEVLDYFSDKIQNKVLSLIVVFDAHNEYGQFSRTYYKNIEVIYSSHNQIADDFIIEHVKFNKEPQNITVVSNDQGLIKEVKKLRAHTSSFENFQKKLDKKKSHLDDKPNRNQFGSQDQEYYLKNFKS